MEARARIKRGPWVVALAIASVGLAAPAAAPDGRSSIESSSLRGWLTYLASDELEGRATYSSGLGLAAGYIQSHLSEWGLRPAGDNTSYLQTVEVHTVRSTSRSSVTVRVGSETKTFADHGGVTFPAQAGVKRTLTVDRVQFVGYGLDAPVINHRDYRDLDVRGTAVIWLGPGGPKAALDQGYRRLLGGRGRYATEQMNALASIGPEMPEVGEAQSGNDARPNSEFVTAQRLDHEIAPVVRASDEFLDFLFSHAPEKYVELKRAAEAHEPLPQFVLSGVSITFNIDHDYEIVRTQRTQNVVGIVEGDDPQLKNTYVAFGAHYDHVGYAESEIDNEGHRPNAPGRVTANAESDRVWNGADDDGSGSAALMALAKAFATGPRPKRSLLFVWHAGEERGLLGSRFFVDHPTVPLDRIVAQLNVDMIGRNRDDKASESNTVYLVGSDRISTELHEISRAANRSLSPPLTLDYELNDPADLEQFYYRSDHYSYAARGIPIIFFTTGLHGDYHANTDEVSKIEFQKLTRITQLIYETGARVANLDHQPLRDNKGPRAGKGSPG